MTVPARAERVLPFTRLYERLLLVLVALLPLLAIAYLHILQDPALKLEHHGVHGLAILIAIAQSAFITYVTWRCYAASGEPLLRWLTLSLLGFSLVYAPHGLFTPLSHEHSALFLLYGPVSRLAMAACLLVGLLAYGRASDSDTVRIDLRSWRAWIAGFLILDFFVAAVALGAGAYAQPIRLAIESAALLLALLGVALMIRRRIRSPLMLIYAIALAYFAQSSFAFLLADAWNHMWWLAHVISVSGFTLLSYGVIRAFHTTRAFSLVFSQEEVMAQLEASKAQAERAAAQLKQANANLEVLAATDPLTGLNNRRHFMARSRAETSKSARTGEPIAILAIDIDHFKRINDRFGHAAGDEVLRAIAQNVSAQLRPTDLIGRWGGEEFMVLLPATGTAQAHNIAERIRLGVEALRVESGGTEISVTLSIGVAEYPTDGSGLDTVFNRADERLYDAKHAGRNRVVAG
ncbi:MAG: GGDEF domain-containing protein [Gammaproteobacteria bacterium]